MFSTYTPAYIYIAMNGWSALQCVRVRVTVIGVIVSIRLIQDVSAILGMTMSQLR